jgi:hypothetical protein
MNEKMENETSSQPGQRIRFLEKELEKFSNGMLDITEDEKELKYKHVFQTRPTATTVGERIRSPMGMFTREQTYIDNDCQSLLDHLNQYYKSI